MTGVTVVVRRRVRPDAHDAFEGWLREVIATASRFDGHLGAEVIRPSTPAQDWVLVFRFASREQLAVWEASRERAEALEAVRAHTLGEASVEAVTGLEYWFTLPANAAIRPPPPWKMAIVTVVGLYPLILFVAPLLGRAFAPLPGPLGTLLTVCTMVALMTWGVMPLLVRTFRPWLFPR